MLEQYENITGKKNTLFTIIIYNSELSEVIDDLKKRIEKTKNISNSFKKKIIINRLYNFKIYLEENYKNEKLNSIFLVSDEIIDIKISKKNISILNEYNFKNIFFKYDSHFLISYINKLFNDFDFANIIQIKNNQFIHFILNSTKKKKLCTLKISKSKENKEIHDYLNKIDSPFILTGSTSTLKNLPEGNIIFSNNKIISDDEILVIYQNYQKKKNQDVLEMYFNNINSPSFNNKIIYGNFDDFIKPEIELYRIEKLFYHTKSKEIINKLDQSYINFDIFEIHTIQKNDIGEKLLNDFGGFFGLRYY